MSVLHCETRLQHLHLHLQLRSSRLRNGKRVGPHGNLHNLRNGGDFGFLERIPENRRGVQTGHHKHCTYIVVQSLHKRGTHRTRLAQELHNIFVRLKRIRHLVRTCLTFCCSRTCLAPRAHNLTHSLFLLPQHQNTHYNRERAIYSKNTGYIINLSKNSQSTSGAIKNHSGVKTCRVAETLAKLSSTYCTTSFASRFPPWSLGVDCGAGVVKVGMGLHILFLMEWMDHLRGSQEDNHFPRVGVGWRVDAAWTTGTACGGTRHGVPAGQPSRRGCTSGAPFLIRYTRV